MKLLSIQMILSPRAILKVIIYIRETVFHLYLDGTLCGWSQKRVRGGKNYLWRIDTERSVAVNEKSKSKTDIIIQTGRPGNGMKTTHLVYPLGCDLLKRKHPLLTLSYHFSL